MQLILNHTGEMILVLKCDKSVAELVKILYYNDNEDDGEGDDIGVNADDDDNGGYDYDDHDNDVDDYAGDCYD